MPELKELLEEILTLETWKEIEKRFIAFRRRTKFVPKKNVMYHLYMSQEVRNESHLLRAYTTWVYEVETHHKCAGTFTVVTPVCSLAPPPTSLTSMQQCLERSTFLCPCLVWFAWMRGHYSSAYYETCIDTTIRSEFLRSLSPQFIPRNRAYSQPMNPFPPALPE